MAADAVDNVPDAAARVARLDPENDPAYRSVVTQLGRNAARLKTPGKRADEKAREKADEVKGASLLPPVRRQEERGYQQQMVDLGAAPIPKIQEFTVDTFMAAFQRGFEELARQLPKASENNRAVSNAVDFSSEKAVAVGNLESQRDDKSRALRETAARPPMEAPEAKVTPPDALELTRDASGPVPVVRNAAAAAPKPIPSEDISLDDQSKALDDALTNQVAGGQTLTISEASLALPASGEKDFDEAGEAKRKAQEAIRKLIPSYRVIEAGTLNKARSNAAGLVETGLRDYHGVRHESFGAVLGHQERQEKSVEGHKDVVLTAFARIYGEKKKAVDDELNALNTIGDDFQQVLTDVETGLKKWVRTDLEYIYTPGTFDYSDWIDEAQVQRDIEQELRRLRSLSSGSMEDPWMYFKALKAVQDKHARALFGDAKDRFLGRVMSEARTIAQRIVDALNRASQHIRDGQTDTEKMYRGLSATEQIHYSGAYAAAIGQYTSLAELVADKHREIVGDMARSYHKVAGTLDATFEAIRKDVLTRWWEKAWNKIKAVVNAIIDFATRIAELLGRMVHLLGDIISSPRYFFTNLVTGIGRGLSAFVERIDTFLAEAFFDWLRGATGVSVQLPKDWDPKGIFGLFTQLLGLSVETIWQRMEVVYDKTVANAFRRGEVLLDKGLELFAIVKADGLGGLWTHIKDSLGTILSDALESMKETILYTAIKKVMFEIGKLLVPGGGFIAIAEKIIRLLQFIVEARDKILNLIESFVESMELAVKGDVSGIISRITGALKSFITVALDFLVTFFGLGGLKSKIERVIERMRSPVIRGIDWVLGKLKPVVMRVKGAAGAIKERVMGFLGLRKTVRHPSGVAHTLFFQQRGSRIDLMIASDTTQLILWINGITNRPNLREHQEHARVLIAEIDRLEDLTRSANTDHTADISQLLQELGVEVLALMGPMLADSARTTAPVFAGLRNGFGRGMRVTLATDDLRVGSEPDAPSFATWASLTRRRICNKPAYPYYVAGHLMNEKLGGTGLIWDNLTPLSRKGNAQHNVQIESHLRPEGARQDVRYPRVFIYAVTPIYSRKLNDHLIAQINSPANPDSPSIKLIKTEVVTAEQYIPTGLKCSLEQRDESGRKVIEHGNTYTVDNPVDESSPADYCVR